MPLRNLASLSSSLVNFVYIMCNLIPLFGRGGIFLNGANAFQTVSSYSTYSVEGGKKKKEKADFFLKHDFIRMLEILLEVVKHSKNLSDFVNGLGKKAILNVAAWNEVEICILKHSLGFCFSRPVFQLCQTWGCSRLPSLAYEGCYEFQSQEISTCLKLSEIIYFKSRFGLSQPHAYLTVLSLFVRFQAMNTIYCLKFLFFWYTP